MPERRTVLGLVGAAAGTAFAGAAAGGRIGRTTDSHETAGITDSHVAYVRNVEEVRGHLTSAATLLADGRREDAALHAGHGPDYYAAVLPPVRDAKPDLATRLRARLGAVSERVQSLDADAFEAYVTEQVFPLLDEAVSTVVPADARGSVAFNAQVMNALAGRIAEEYAAAVTADGQIKLEGEYWDGRGFLTRIETRYDAAAFDDAATRALERLRSRMEAVEPPAAVGETSLRFRVAVAAAADLPSASVEGVEDAVAYVRAAEEVRGHVHSSAALLRAGDADAASLHASHGSDYVMSLLPAVRAQNSALADTLLDRLVALDERVDAASVAEYRQFASEKLFPALAEAVAVAVPDEYAGTSFSARVTVALLGRIEQEYTKAVTDDEVVELYGEYWDARGFFERVRTRYDAMKSDLSEETRELVEPELEILEGELRTAAPPWDVANSVEPLTDDLSRAIEE